MYKLRILWRRPWWAVCLLCRDSAGAEWGAAAGSGGAAAGRLQWAAGQGQRQGSRPGQRASQGNKWFFKCEGYKNVPSIISFCTHQNWRKKLWKKHSRIFCRFHFLAFFLALNIKGTVSRDFFLLVFFMNHGGWGLGRSKDDLGRNTRKGVSFWRDKVYIRFEFYSSLFKWYICVHIVL